jgi:hypothetical protein
MEEAVAGNSTVAPLDGIDIDVDNLINDADPIGAGEFRLIPTFF